MSEKLEFSQGVAESDESDGNGKRKRKTQIVLQKRSHGCFNCNGNTHKVWTDKIVNGHYPQYKQVPITTKCPFQKPCRYSCCSLCLAVIFAVWKFVRGPLFGRPKKKLAWTVVESCGFILVLIPITFAIYWEFHCHTGKSFISRYPRCAKAVGIFFYLIMLVIMPIFHLNKKIEHADEDSLHFYEWLGINALWITYFIIIFDYLGSTEVTIPAGEWGFSVTDFGRINSVDKGGLIDKKVRYAVNRKVLMVGDNKFDTVKDEFKDARDNRKEITLLIDGPSYIEDFKEFIWKFEHGHLVRFVSVVMLCAVIFIATTLSVDSLGETNKFLMYLVLQMSFFVAIAYSDYIFFVLQNSDWACALACMTVIGFFILRGIEWLRPEIQLLSYHEHPWVIVDHMTLITFVACQFLILGTVALAAFAELSIFLQDLNAIVVFALYSIFAILGMINPFFAASVIDLCGGLLLTRVMLNADYTEAEIYSTVIFFILFLHFIGSCIQWWLGKLPFVQLWLNKTAPLLMLTASDSAYKDADVLKAGLIGGLFPDTINGFNQGRMGMSFCIQFWSEWSAIPNAVCVIVVGMLLASDESSATEVIPIVGIVAVVVNVIQAFYAANIFRDALLKTDFWTAKEKWTAVQHFYKMGYWPTKKGWAEDVYKFAEWGGKDKSGKPRMGLYDRLNPHYEKYTEDIRTDGADLQELTHDLESILEDQRDVHYEQLLETFDNEINGPIAQGLLIEDKAMASSYQIELDELDRIGAPRPFGNRDSTVTPEVPADIVDTGSTSLVVLDPSAVSPDDIDDAATIPPDNIDDPATVAPDNIDDTSTIDVENRLENYSNKKPEPRGDSIKWVHNWEWTTRGWKSTPALQQLFLFAWIAATAAYAVFYFRFEDTLEAQQNGFEEINNSQNWRLGLAAYGVHLIFAFIYWMSDLQKMSCCSFSCINVDSDMETAFKPIPWPLEDVAKLTAEANSIAVNGEEKQLQL